MSWFFYRGWTTGHARDFPQAWPFGMCKKRGSSACRRWWNDQKTWAMPSGPKISWNWQTFMLFHAGFMLFHAISCYFMLFCAISSIIAFKLAAAHLGAPMGTHKKLSDSHYYLLNGPSHFSWNPYKVVLPVLSWFINPMNTSSLNP